MSNSHVSVLGVPPSPSLRSPSYSTALPSHMCSLSLGGCVGVVPRLLYSGSRENEFAVRHYGLSAWFRAAVCSLFVRSCSKVLLVLLVVCLGMTCTHPECVQSVVAYVCVVDDVVTNRKERASCPLDKQKKMENNFYVHCFSAGLRKARRPHYVHRKAHDRSS